MADPVWLQKQLKKAEEDRNYGDLIRSGVEGYSPVGAQVDQLRGSDDFQAQFQKLKKLPSTIPQMTQETKDVYNKYNRFLRFAGATTGDYSGSSSFQSGLSAALDMDMIQDLLEEQRENTFARQFDDAPVYKEPERCHKVCLGGGCKLEGNRKGPRCLDEIQG